MSPEFYLGGRNEGISCTLSITHRYITTAIQYRTEAVVQELVSTESIKIRKRLSKTKLLRILPVSIGYKAEINSGETIQWP